MSVAGIVLAAGFSRRLGRPKQSVTIAGETLIERSVRMAREAGLDPILLVIQPQASFLEHCRTLGCELVCNEGAEEGIAASIRAGVAAARQVPGLHGVVLMTCDQPGVRPEHLRALSAERDRITGSAYASKVAVPAYFPSSAFEQLLTLQGDMGARTLLQGAYHIAAEALALDIDTEEDITAAEEYLAAETSPQKGVSG